MIKKTCEVCGTSEGKVYGKSGKHKMDLCYKHRRELDVYGEFKERTRVSPNEFIANKEYLEIILYTDGVETNRAIVDINRYDDVKQYKWIEMTNGYVCGTKKGRPIYLHRLVTNTFSDMVVDHINHNTMDNRSINLRVCTHQENCCNQIVRKNNTSGYKGVVWNKKRNQWQAQIVIYGKQKHLGYFDDINDAIAARREAEIKYFGEFHHINQVNQSKQEVS